jgi:hypothetical protein
MKDISGSFRVSIQFPEIGVFELSLDKSLRISTILLGLSPWLRADSSRFCLQYGQKTLSNTSQVNYFGICANSELRVVESQESVKTPQISMPSQFLAREDFVRKLLDTLVAPHSEEFCRACEKLLDYLPSDQTIKNASANPEPFLANLKTIDNQHILVYHLQILQWRIQCPFYLTRYKSAGLTDLLTEFLQTAPRSAGVIVNILAAFGEVIYSDFLKPLLSALANPAFPIDSEVAVSQYLAKKFDVNLGLNMQLIDKALLMMVHPVWDEFSEFLRKIADSRQLYELSLLHLDNQMFRDIFTHFVAIPSDDARDRFTLCLDLLENGFWNKTASALIKLVTVNASSLIDSPDLILRLVQILKKSDVRNSTTVYDLLAQLAELSSAYARVVDEFLNDLALFETNRWSFSQVEPNFQKLCGLRNLGATCDQNSIFQQILRILAFQHLLLAEVCRDDSSLHAL